MFFYFGYMNEYPRFDLHVHTVYSDGFAEPEKVVESVLGTNLKLLGIADHGPGLGVGITNSNFERYIKDIRILKKDSDLPILLGIEANILDSEGRLDIPSYLVNELDYIMAGIHLAEYSSMDLDRFARGYLERLIKSIEDNEIDIISHPFWYRGDVSRHLSVEEIDSFIEVALRNNVAVELNQKYRAPDGLLLSRLLNSDLKISLGSDAHSLEEVGMVEWGIGRLKESGTEKSRLVFSDLMGDLDYGTGSF